MALQNKRVSNTLSFRIETITRLNLKHISKSSKKLTKIIGQEINKERTQKCWKKEEVDKAHDKKFLLCSEFRE